MSINSTSSFFFEHKTAIKPITTLSKARINAKTKPILRFLPMQPTPYASATAINKKNTDSPFIIKKY